MGPLAVHVHHSTSFSVRGCKCRWEHQTSLQKQWLISSPRDIPPCRNASVRASGQRLCNGAGLRVVLRRGPWRIRGVVLCVPFGMWLDWSLFAGWRQRAPIPRTVHQRSDNCPVTLSLLHSLCIAGRGNATADDQKKKIILHLTKPSILDEKYVWITKNGINDREISPEAQILVELGVPTSTTTSFRSLSKQILHAKLMICQFIYDHLLYMLQMLTNNGRIN